MTMTTADTLSDAARTGLSRRGRALARRGEAPLPRWFAAVFATLRGLETGAAEFRLPDGRLFRAEGRRPGPLAQVEVHDPRLFARMIRDGEMGFAEAYLDGWWDSPDLQAVLDVALLNNRAVSRRFGGARAMRLLRRVQHWTRRNTRSQARRNIAAHYDLGNDFYAEWLDESMTYSAALFETGAEATEAAQQAKYAALLDAIDPPEGGHVLEIGCGWGGFAEYAAKARGLRVTALTLSAEQKAYAEARMARAGLSDRVQIALRDYRDETGVYDGVASIEMFEAVGEKYWPVYFDALRARLKPGARAGLQVITIADELFDEYRRGMDFVQKYIFPGGMLPSPSRLQAEARSAGLRVDATTEFGSSYAETLRRWRARFHDGWPRIEPMGFDDRFRRMWDFYLASCASCFMAGATDVAHIRVSRPE